MKIFVFYIEKFLQKGCIFVSISLLGPLIKQRREELGLTQVSHPMLESSIMVDENQEKYYAVCRKDYFRTMTWKNRV